MDFDPNKKEDLELLLELFNRLTPEQQEEIRVSMGLKQREIAQERLNAIGVHLSNHT
jgi:hypothetical protein